MRNICNVCGGNLIYKNGKWICEACGAYAVEEITNEENTNFYAANQKLRLSNFEEAEELYSDIIRQYPNNAYGYWGLLKAQYGIIYEKDYDGKMIPSCYNTTYESLYENKNYIKAYELGDDDQKAYFKDQAEKIEKVRKEWIEKASKEEPYDIFLSYKATEQLDGNERKTDDYSEAYEIYNTLVSWGYRVFFSRVSLQDKVGEKYEPYIFNALNTAQIMIVYSSKIEYTNATWVRNEYLRYDKRIKKGDKIKNSLILVYKDFNPSELSKPLKDIQNLNRDDINFKDDLKKYVDKIIIESRRKVATIDRVEIKAFEVKEDKKIKKIDKKELKNKAIKQDKIIIEKAETREIGKYSSVKFNADLEQQIKVAYSFLDKGLFKDAEAYFNKILENTNNSHNPQVLLGKVLAHDHINNIDELFKNNLLNLTNLDLLLESFEYSSKEDAEQYLSKFVDVILNLIKFKNFEKAYEIYSKICDYNVKSIQSNHYTIAKECINQYASNEYLLKIIDTSLKFIISNKMKYSFVVTSIINKLLDDKKDVTAKKYYDEAYKILSDDYGFLFFDLKIKARTSNLNDALCYYLTSGNANLIEKIESIDRGNANKLLNNLALTIINNFRSDSFNKNFKNVEHNIKIIINYDFDQYQNFIDSISKVIVEHPCENYNFLFELLIPQKYANDNNGEINIEGLINDCINYSNGYLSNNDFIRAKRYANFGLSYNQKNIELLKLLLQISICANSKEAIADKIYDFNDFELFERILSFYDDEDKMVKFIDEMCNDCTKYLSNFSSDNKSINRQIFNVFDSFIRYYPEAYNHNLLNSLELFADASKNARLFDEADKYYSMMTGIDQNQYNAYWGLLQVHLKCSNNEELIHQYKPISNISDFTNAIFAASNNEKSLNVFIDCRVKQEEWLKLKQEEEIKKKEAEAKRKKRKKKLIISLIISLIIAAIASITGALFVNIFIPTKRYNEAIALINNGDYYSAFNKLNSIKKDDFKDKKNQLLICHAGITFNSGNIDNGLEYFLEAGGKITVNYDPNGGNINKKNETINQKSNNYFIDYPDSNIESHKANNLNSNEIIEGRINNDPSKTGYKFTHWTISNFVIKTSFENYECTLNLLANYSPIQYSISYDLNGGTCSNLPTYYTIETPTFTLGKPIKTGYTFTGWSGTDIETTNTTVTITKGSIGNRSYKANYKANQYKVTLDWQDGVHVKTMTVTYDSKYTLETPYKSGYSFNYWSYNGTKFESSGTWKIASNITLLANYEVKNYSISYDLNTGYIESTKNNPTQYNILTDDFTLINPKKDNYTFSGWTGTDLSEETKNVTIKKGSYGDREYKAHYESTITLKGYNESKTMKVKYNESYTIEKPTRDGYEFDHWYYYEGSKQVTIESSGTWKYPGNITLTATFVKKYTITYYLDGGSFPSGTEVKNEYTMNTETFKIPAVTKEGYKFLGWSGSDINDKVQEITIVKGSEGDRVFYANFEACEYNVTLSYPDGTSEDFQIKYNEHYLINNPKVDDGYQFEYWYYKDGSKEIKIESTGNWTIAHDVTLYAKVTKIESN